MQQQWKNTSYVRLLSAVVSFEWHDMVEVEFEDRNCFFATYERWMASQSRPHHVQVYSKVVSILHNDVCV